MTEAFEVSGAELDSSSAKSSENSVEPDAFLLRELQVFNWGPFGGFHRAEFDPRGSAIVGPTGSGKTTLIDALMTLIVHQPKYNLASTGGHESDRDLMSYIRGVAGAGNEAGGNEHVARRGKTTTGLCATFAAAREALHVAVLFWINSSSTAAADRKEVWLIARTAQAVGSPLNEWLATHKEAGEKGLRQVANEQENLRTFKTRKACQAELRRFFDVGENAFALLNRAAGLKQLNSIDEIFRRLVLDDQAKFDDAARVAAEFDSLADIHAELERARQQQKSLQPIATEQQKYAVLQAQRQQAQRLEQLLPRWFAQQKAALWAQREHELEQALVTVQREIQQLRQQQAERQAKERLAYKQFQQLGGANIELVQKQLDSLTAQRRRCQTDVQQYQQLCHALALDEALNQAVFDANLRQVEAMQADRTGKLRAAEQQWFELGCKRVPLQSRHQELKQEIAAVEARPDSNIPHPFQQFRAALARQLEVDATELPYLAELVEVKADQTDWRGAVERAIGGHRLRLLVPARHLRVALRWVNDRNNRLHVRLLEAEPDAGEARFMEDGFTRKLNFKRHALIQPAKAFLAGIDLHCVADSAALQQVDHGLTRQGTMSGKRGRFDKHDQHALDQGWLTGFDNRDQLRSLRAEFEGCSNELATLDQAVAGKKAEVDTLRKESSFLERFAQWEFDNIDLPTIESAMREVQAELAALSAPDSDLDRQRQRWQQLEAEVEGLGKQIGAQESARGEVNADLKRAKTARAEAVQLGGSALDAESSELVNDHRAKAATVTLDSVDTLERQEIGAIRTELGRLQDRLDDKGKTLVRLMGLAQKVDTGALAEVGTELDDVPKYLERLALLTQEALPEKQQRFQTYLNQSSDQGVTQLLTAVSNEVSVIEERIEELNQTLRRVEFQPGRYLRLQPRKVVHDGLKKLQSAQRHLRAAALKDDGGEAQYAALRNVVELLRDASERRRTVGALALLDPRYRLEFSVALMRREDDYVIETRTGSQGGSGGEKEIIASYILTASLSYALCPSGATRPLFGTVVLDEAFSKSSQAVAGRIVAALREFGLHPLFVTPNKEMRLLRDHTHSAIVVHRLDQQSSLASMSWERLEAEARARVRATPSTEAR